MQHKTIEKIFLALLFLLGWFALIAQFFLNVVGSIAPVSETIIRYFSYFTLDTNLLVTLCATLLLFKPRTKLTNFFSRQTTQTALAVYILIVALIYNLILRFLWCPRGLQRTVDELLHLVNPLLFIIYWAIYSKKIKLKWTAFLPWLLFPFIYLFMVLIRANWSGFYPYPFINVDASGFNSVVVNCLGIAFLFIIISWLFIAIGNYIVKQRNTK